MEHTEEILTETAAKKPAKRATKRTTKAAAKTTKTAETVKTAEAPKTAAKAPALKPEIIVQCNFTECDISNVVDAAKAAFKSENGRTAVKSCKIYVKPEERAAYYVINDEFTGKLDL